LSAEVCRPVLSFAILFVIFLDAEVY